MAIADRLRSLFGSEKKAFTSFTLSDRDIGELLGAISTRTGLAIGPASAMRVPAVACATALIADTPGRPGGERRRRKREVDGRLRRALTAAE